MLGEGLHKLLLGGVGAVHIAEVLCDILACETVMQWNDKSSILLAI